MTRLYRRRKGLTERSLAKTVFLAHPKLGALYRLNETGSALWRLLADPISIEECVRVFQQAFPDDPAETIDEQVRSLLEVLIEDDLVEEV